MDPFKFELTHRVHQFVLDVTFRPRVHDPANRNQIASLHDGSLIEFSLRKIRYRRSIDSR